MKCKKSTQKQVGSESPCRAELPSADLHILFFQIHHLWRFFKNNYYLKSSHRLKSISGTIIILVNNNNYDLIAILLLGGGLESHSRMNQGFSYFFENLRGLQAS